MVVAKMNEFKRGLIVQVPACLVDATNQVINVAFSVLFALVFLTLYSPFSETSWFQVGLSDRFLWTAFFVVVSTSFLISSRLLMSYLVKRRRHFSLLLYVIWLLLEIIIIGTFHAFISWHLIKMPDFTLSFIFGKSLLITFLALGCPFVITDLIFLLYDTRKMLLLTHTSSIESDDETIPKNADIINIMDNNGNLKLSVKLDNLYYIKSEDNYINVFYTKKGVVSSYLLRCKLQTIENNFSGRGVLMRCHRSYIVNTEKVKVLRNESDGFYMDFDCDGIDSIPVSKTYTEKVIKRFSNK
jgi:Response regulator of the LytR/AlgR family